MPRIVWVNPTSPRKQQYITTDANDPSVPAGYVRTNTSDGSWQGADSVTDQDMQTQVAGTSSGGWPPYGLAVPNPNGILGG
jgi:hypothetical protein